VALPSKYRWIAVGKLVLRKGKNVPNCAPQFEVQDLINALKDRIAREKQRKQPNTQRMYRNNDKLMWCKHVDEDPQYYHLILQIGDKNVTGMSFLNFSNFTTRDINKKSNEGSHYTSHILIKKNPIYLGNYLILIEKVPGVSLSSIKDHFTWVCNNDNYKKEFRNSNNQTKKFRPIFEVQGHQSKTIREALETGTLQDVELVKHDKNYKDGLDEDPIVQEVVQEIRFEVKRRVSGDQLNDLVHKLLSQNYINGTDITQMFIRIKTANNQIKSTQVDYNNDDILEQAFIQNEAVTDFSNPLPQRYENFHDEMIEKMSKIAETIGD